MKLKQSLILKQMRRINGDAKKLAKMIEKDTKKMCHLLGVSEEERKQLSAQLKKNMFNHGGKNRWKSEMTIN